MATQFYITSYIAQQGTAYGSMRADGTYAGSAKGHMWVDFSGESKSYGYGDGGVIYTDSKDYKNIDGYPNIIAIRHEVTESEYYAALDFAKSSEKSGNWEPGNGIFNFQGDTWWYKPGGYTYLGNACVDFHWAILSAGGLVKDPNYQGNLSPIDNEFYLNNLEQMNYFYENGRGLQSDEDLQNYFNGWEKYKAQKEQDRLSGLITDITMQVIDDLIDLNPWRSILNGLMRFATFDNAPAPRDPIILDLNGDGISTIASGGNTGQKFDFNDDGLKTAAGWVAPTDGVLGIDQNGDGKLTSGKELIGDQTELKDGRIATHGYEVIADLDSNGDGVINALDPDFHKLRVWVDKNSDGISQADELFTLTDLGIIGLNLEHKMTSETLNGNNVLSHIGSYIKADGTTGLMGNVNFMPDDLYTEYVDKIPLTPEQAAMSNIGGLGRVRPLAEALTLSSDLRLKFDVYRTAVTKAEQLEALEDLLWAWAATESKFQRVIFQDAKFVVGSTNAVGSGGGSGGEINLQADPLGERWAAAEIKVSILNSFFNLEHRSFYKLPAEYNSATKTWSNQAANTSTLDTIDRIYHQLTSNMYMELLVETRLSPYLQQITVTEAGLDFTKVITVFNHVAMIDTRKAFVDLVLIDNDENNLIFNAIQNKNSFVFCGKSVFS